MHFSRELLLSTVRAVAAAAGCAEKKKDGAQVECDWSTHLHLNATTTTNPQVSQ